MKTAFLALFLCLVPLAVLADSAANTVSITNRQVYVRVVDGIAYDFSPVFNALNGVREKVKDGRNRIDAVRSKIKNLSAKEDDLVDVDMHSDDAEKVFKPFVRYSLQGHVSQVLEDGLLVECENGLFCGYNGTVFVKNYKKQDTVIDGDEVITFGLAAGRYQYISVTGAKKTVQLFYCARKPSKEIPDSEIKALPK